MALDPLIAKANVGAGTDTLAGRTTGAGFVGAVLLTDASGAEVASGNPLPVVIQGSIPVTIASAIEVTNDAGNPLPVSGVVAVSNFPASQSVTGTFWQATQPVSVAALPLPVGAATEATLAAVNAKLPALLTSAPASDAAAPPVRLVGGLTLNATDDTASGNLSVLGAAVTVNLNGRGSLGVQMKASTVPAFAGTLMFEGTINGTDWEPLRGFYAGSPGEAYTQVTETLVNNIFRFTVGGIAQFRVRLASLTLGNVDVSIRAADATSNVLINAPVSILATRRDSDTATAVDGAMSALYSDETGRLKVSTQPGSLAAITGSITASAQTVAGSVAGASNIMAYVTGTFAGHNSTFEGSIDGGTSWFGVQAVRSNANTIELVTGVLGGAPAYAWELSVNTLTNFRVRATAHTSGTANWRFQPGSYATEPIPAAQISGTQPVSGTVTATVTAGTINPVVPATPYFLNSAASTNGALILTGTSNVSSFYATNDGASVAYVKLYNKATAPTVGTDVPEMVIPVPAAAGGVPGVANPNIGFHGFRFALGLGIAVTGGAANSDTTAVAAGQVKVKLSRTV